MRIDTSVQSHGELGRHTLSLVLREAKALHRAAVSESLAASLPVLRRLLASQVIRSMSLTELRRCRHRVQRKHVLRVLAIEAGYAGWNEYRAAIAEAQPEALQPFDVLRRTAGYPNLWFSSLKEAEDYAVVQGGHPIRVGRQAVIFAAG